MTGVWGVPVSFNKQPAGSTFSNDDLILVTSLSNQIALVPGSRRLRRTIRQPGEKQLGLLLKFWKRLTPASRSISSWII